MKFELQKADAGDPVAFVHNYVLEGLHDFGTKAGELDLRSETTTQLLTELACEAGEEIGIIVAPDEIFDLTRDNQINFFDKFDKDGIMATLSYIEQFPYEESVITEIGRRYISDVQEGTNSFEEYLVQLADYQTKAGCNSPYSYSKLYNFYLSDCALWDNYYQTKGDKGRHAVSVATDILVGAALCGLSGLGGALIAGAVGALASEVMENGKMDPDSGTDDVHTVPDEWLKRLQVDIDV